MTPPGLELSGTARAGLAIAKAEIVLTAIGLGTIGLVWMVRIYREARRV